MPDTCSPLAIAEHVLPTCTGSVQPVPVAPKQKQQQQQDTIVLLAAADAIKKGSSSVLAAAAKLVQHWAPRYWF